MKFFKKKSFLDLILDPAHQKAGSSPSVSHEEVKEKKAPSVSPIASSVSSASKPVVEAPAAKKVSVRHTPPLDMPLPDEGTWFYLSSGKPLASLRELYDALASMGDDTWAHHVNGEKNDFANWIAAVFQSEALAEQVREAPTQWALRTVLSRYL